MMKIGLSIPHEPSLALTLMKQCGVEHAVSHQSLQPIDGASDDEQPWTLTSLAKRKQAYEDLGFELAVIEGRPAMEKIKLALPGRDAEIDVVCQMLINMGKLGIPVSCSMWMPILGVMRSSRALPTRAGATVSGSDLSQVEEGLTERGVVSEEEQWENLQYFLEHTVPVAEEAGVKMAMHPDDPPLSPIHGVARIMSSLDNYQCMLDMVPSPMNGIALCQGNFGLMTDDLPATIRHFGGQGKIHFVHLRDVRGNRTTFRRLSMMTASTIWPSVCAPTGMPVSTASVVLITIRVWATSPSTMICAWLGSSPWATSRGCTRPYTANRLQRFHEVVVSRSSQIYRKAAHG